MKSNELKTLRDKTLDELQAQLNQWQEKLIKSTLELKAAKLDDIKLPSKLRNEIAQIKTIIREKELLVEAKSKLASEEGKAA